MQLQSSEYRLGVACHSSYRLEAGLSPRADLLPPCACMALVRFVLSNIANLFTPQGEPDPLSLLPLLVGVWQAATPEDCARLLDMVTLGAHFAAGSDMPDLDLGLASEASHSFMQGQRETVSGLRGLYGTACLLLPGVTTVQEAVLRPPHARVLVRQGRVISERRVEETIWSASAERGDKNSH